MKTDNYNTRRFAPCLVMYLLSAILMTWRLWLPDYVQYAPSGDRALYTTVVLEITFAVRTPHREIGSTGEIEQRFRWN